MAMARPAVVTTAAARVLSARPGIELEVADDAAAFAAKVLAVMDPAIAEGMGRRARERILTDYAWSSRFARLDELLAYSDAPRLAPVPASPSARPAAAAVSAP